MSRKVIISIFLFIFLTGKATPQNSTNQKVYTGQRTENILFSAKNSNYRIAVSSKAPESERWAAEELQHWLKEISGIKLPIQRVETAYNGPQIVVGYNDFVKEKTGKAAPADLDESFTYCSYGPDILIYGGKQRGTMYGVMAFLENEFGCRWYTPSVSVIPKREEYAFASFDHSEAPGIRVRNDFYFEAFDGIWAARNRMNGAMYTRDQPGGIEGYWSVHTFFPLVPPSEFYDKHPEYYSLIDNKRIHKDAQLCLTNPDVLKILTERLKKRMRESPEYLIYDVSQNDRANPCQCDKCQAIVEKEGSESGVIVWFVNQVAEAIKKEFPDKFIGTLAYKYSRKPCKNIRPRHNVVVRLCSIECCFSHDIESCPRNMAFLDDLKGWSAIAQNLYIWDYVVYFQHYIMPYPNILVLQPNIRIFQENNAIGIMEQADYQSRGGEFAELRSYLISRLLWNPECNVEDVINDFMYGYYGRAGMFVRQYFDLLYGRITPEAHIHIESHKYNRLSAEDEIFSGDFIEQSSQIFSDAAKVADNDEILHRVEMASLPILYLKCKLTPADARIDGTYAKFRQIVDREGITHYAEYGAESNQDVFHERIENAQ